MRIERRGGQFVLSEVEPDLHEAAKDLGFVRNAGAFVRTFPEDARWLDHAWRNFVEHAPAMLRQAAAGPVPWDHALVQFLERVEGVEWWLAGSGALAVRGVPISPRDLDVITDAPGAERLGELLVDALVEPVFAGEGWVARWWGRAFLGARVEWVGEVAASVDEPEPVDFGPTAAAALETVRWRGYELRVPPLELQLAVARRRGLADRATAISRSIAGVRELRPGLWHWEAPHPEWRPSEPWDQNVSSYAIDDGARLLLFDPLAPPSEIEQLATERDTAIVLTAPWHERDAQRLVERHGPPVYTPLPDTAEYLMEKYGLTAEQAGDGSPDVVWLLKEGIGEARLYGAGDRLDVGVQAFPGQKPNDMVLWIESHRAVIAGDTLGEFGHGLQINPRWLGPGVTLEQVVEGLRPLLELPVEHMLATHGGPYDRDALERALSL